MRRLQEGAIRQPDVSGRESTAVWRLVVVGASEHLFWCPFSHRYIIGIFSGNGTRGTVERRGGDKIKENFHMPLFPHRVIQ